MMNILYLTNIPSPYRVEFFNELGKFCNLTVLFERKLAKDREEEWLLNKFDTFQVHFLRGISIGNDSALSFEVIKYLKQKKNEIIVVGGYSTPTSMLAINYLRLKKTPFILNVDGGIIKSDSKLRYMIKRFFISAAHSWMSSSDETTNYLIHYGANKSNIFKFPFTSISDKDVVNCPLSMEEKEIMRKKLNMSEDRVVLAVGRFISIKGFDTLIKATSFIDYSIGVYIIGGKVTDEYSNLKHSLNLKNVHFIDFKTREKLAEFYKASDLFVLPTRGDVWGLVVNEAMAYGLPVITTNKCIAGLELVEEWKNGFIVPVDDEKALAEKITIAFNNELLLEEMSNNNLKKIKLYTIENMVKVHVDIFSKYKVR